MDQKIIQIHDKKFEPFIKFAEIDKAVAKIADRMNEDLHDKKPLFLAILNGSFMFASDLFHKIDFLWKFHKVHHAPRVLNILTAARFHPVERAVNYIINSAVAATITALFLFFTSYKVEIVTVLNAGIFFILFPVIIFTLIYVYLNKRLSI